MRQAGHGSGGAIDDRCRQGRGYRLPLVLRRERAQHPGPWVPWLDQTFGVTHHLRYGIPDVVPAGEVSFELVQEIGDLAPGTRLTFVAAGEGTGSAYLPVDASGADVLAVDDRGRPALLRNRIGAGWVVLCTYPIEYMAASSPAANPEATWQLYSALADMAGVSRPLRAEDPRVTIGALRVGGKDAFLAMNISPDVMDIRLVPRVGAISRAPAGERIETLHIAPYEVALLYREYAEHRPALPILAR